MMNKVKINELKEIRGTANKGTWKSLKEREKAKKKKQKEEWNGKEREQKRNKVVTVE
jgi:hypothetical protein